MSALEEEFALQIMAMRLPGCYREYRFCPGRRYRFDFAFPAKMIAVEVDGGSWTGGRHTRGVGFRDDCRKLNLAAKLGWRVLRGTSDMVKSG